MSTLRQSLVNEAIALYESNPFLRERFSLTGIAGIRKTSTARLTTILERARIAPPTLAADGFQFSDETPLDSRLEFTGKLIKRPSLRFFTEVDLRISSPIKPALVHLSRGRAVDWRPRTRIEWVIIQRRARPIYGAADVRNGEEAIAAVRLAIEAATRYAYVDTVTVYLTSPEVPRAEVPLPLLERHPRRNCVVNGLLEATPKASRQEIEAVIRERHPDLFEPSKVGPATIEKLAKLSGYQIEFYSPLARHLEVAPWATFNDSAKHRRKVRMYVDGYHASLDIGKSWTEVEYVSQERLDRYEARLNRGEQRFEGYEVHQVRVDLEGPTRAIKALVIAKKGKLVIVKREDTRPSLYTTDIKDDDTSYAHLLSKDDILCELFRKRFPSMPAGSNISEICKRSEKFPRNSLLKRHSGPLITIDHNRSFMSYERHPSYIGFPFTRFISAAGNCPAQGDLKPAFYVLSSISWFDLDAQHVFNATVNDVNPEYVSAVMFNFLQRYATMEVSYTVMACFAKESVLEFTDRAKLTREEHKRLSCRLIGSLIKGGLSETRTGRVDVHKTTRDQVYKELNIAAQQGLVTHFREEENSFSFTMPNKTFETRYHVHSYVLDYSTTTTMNHFIQAYKRAPSSVVSICADAIRIEPQAFDQIKSLFDFGNKPGQWKSETDVLPGCYSFFTVVPYPVKKASFTNNEVMPDHVFKELPYNNTRVFISGAGGTGKTHHIIERSSTDLIMLFPTRELRDHFKSACDAEARTLAWYLKRSELGHLPPQGLVVLDEVFMFSREQIAALLHYTQQKHVYLIGDPAQVHNSFGTPFTEEDLSRAWQRVNFKRGEVSRHGRRFGEYLDELRELTDEEILDDLKVVLEEFDGRYEADDIALVATHAEARGVTQCFLVEHPESCPIKRVRANKKLPDYGMTSDTYALDAPRDDGYGDMQSLGELSELTWFGRQSMKAELPEDHYYEPYMARTVHSQQGRTVTGSRVLVSPSLVKIPGALYTAVSRVRCMDQLRLGVMPPYEQEETTYYDNDEGRDY